MGNFARNCDEKFQTVDVVIADQAKQFHSATSALQEQFRAIGAELMGKLTQMQVEPPGNKKRRSAEDEPMEEALAGAEASHRGGMNKEIEDRQTQFKALADRLKEVLVQNNLAHRGCCSGQDQSNGCGY